MVVSHTSIFKKNFTVLNLDNTKYFLPNQISGSSQRTNQWKSGDMDSTGTMLDTVNQQTATVLFYSVLDEKFLLWVIQLGVGITRFYIGKQEENCKFGTKIQNLVNKILKLNDQQTFGYTSENRSLPLKGTDLERLQRSNLALSSKNSLVRTVEDEDESGKMEKLSKTVSPERELFDVLLAPIYDILSKLEPQSPLIIVPDKELHNVSFGMLQDWNNLSISCQFRLTYIPSLAHLHMVTQGHREELHSLDDLEVERSQSRHGGHLVEKPRTQSSLDFDDDRKNLDESLNQIDSRRTSLDFKGDRKNVAESEIQIDPRRTSNPRLLSSRMCRTGPRGAPSPTSPPPAARGE